MAYSKSIETKKNILRVTKELIKEDGWENLSVRSIAARAGVKNPLLYYYFKSKQDIADYIFGMLILKIFDFAEDKVPFAEDEMLNHFIYVSVYFRVITENELYKSLYMESAHPFDSPIELEDEYDLNLMVEKQFEGILKKYNVDLPEKYVRAYATGAFAIATSIIRNYILGNIDMTFREAMFFITRFWVISVGIDEKIFEAKLDKALEIAFNADLKIFEDDLTK
ncbi:MAG: TetR/AcrR family transcriptional regulator [Eubacteriaceae bacterium]|nr:TetR/AcrR family transcriptional regulator [Eubacteriaceae bacterium]